MGIKATELQATTSPKVTDTLLLANSAGGTSQLTLAQAAAFLGGEMVKEGNPVGAALSSKAAISAQETVEQKKRNGHYYTLPVTELQAFLNNMPRLIMDGYTFTVSGTLDEQLAIYDFCGCGSIHIKAAERGGCLFRKGIRVSNCGCENVTLQNLAFSNPDAASHNDCEVQALGHQSIYLLNCDFNGNQKGTAIEVGNGTTARALNCTIKNYSHATLTEYDGFLVVSCENAEATSGNLCGARTYHGGIIQLGPGTDPMLGGTYFTKNGGLIVKPNGTLA